jgi:hypothetical protein
MQLLCVRSGKFAENTLKQREPEIYINTMSEVTVSSVAEDECSFCAHSLSQLPYCVIHKKRILPMKFQSGSP